MASEKPKRTVLITGGTGGIGLAIAKKLIDSDFDVALTDIKKKRSVPGLFYHCDIRRPRHIRHLYNWVINKVGVPDVLILNAGVGIKEKLAEGDPEKWQKVFDVNVMGALRCLRAFVPQMLEKNGHIIFISSVSVNQPHEYGGIYTASKTALEVIAETLRIETLPDLHITTISPGAIDTNFFKNQAAGASGDDARLPKIKPEEIAEDVLYCINKTNNRSINKIITRPLAQKF